MPAFPALAAFIASIVGYQIPVVCQPLPQGSTVNYQVSGAFGTASLTSPAVTADAAGVTMSLGVPVGGAFTITIADQAVTLPAAPTDTPNTDELGNPHPGYVYIPVFIALANCDGWTSDSPTARGQTFITAVHEAMHAKYADGNEAVTECRTMQALPTELASLWPGVSDPGLESIAPTAPKRTARWKKLHSAQWRKLTTAYRVAFANWVAADAPWQKAYADWSTYQAILAAATAMDASEPAQYHGGTC